MTAVPLLQGVQDQKRCARGLLLGAAHGAAAAQAMLGSDVFAWPQPHSFLTLPQPEDAEELSSRAERLLHLAAQARARAEVCY